MKKTEVIQPIAIKSPICFSGDRSVLPNTSDDKASIEKGFPQKTQLPLNQGGVAPGRTDFNSLFYLSTDLRFNLQNGCVITFNQEVSDKIGGYPQDAVLSFIDSEGTYKMVKSVIDDNTYNFVSNPNYIDDIHWQEIKMGGGGGLNLFDIIHKDHILSYNEKFGLELLGEYVYKNAVAGTRYGYPDFYNKVVAEYNDPNNTDKEAYISSNITKVGDIKDIKGVVSDFSSSKYFYTNKILNVENNPFEIIIKIKTGNNVSSTQTIISGNTSTTNPPMLIRIESGKLRIWFSSNLSSHDIVNGTVGTYTLATETDYYIKIEWTTIQYIISISTDNQNYTQDITVNSTTAINSTQKLYFAIYQTSYPFLGSFDLNKTKITINNQLYWQGTNTFTYKKNINGHDFFDIADKDKVDEIYNNTGIAWFYGVDTTNERIFLPRNDYLANDGRAVGNGKTLGLKDYQDNHYGLTGRQTGSSADDSFSGDTTNYNVSLSQRISGGTSISWSNNYGITNDPSASGIVLNSFGYVYMVVATTKKQEIAGTIIIPEQEILARLSVAEARIQDIEDADYIEKYENGNNGYILDKRTGFCHQWGKVGNGSSVQITLYKEYKDTNYNISVTGAFTSSGRDGGAWGVIQNTKTISQFNCDIDSYYDNGAYWFTTGFIDLTTI